LPVDCLRTGALNASNIISGKGPLRDLDLVDI
jgi:hypothetical protein